MFEEGDDGGGGVVDLGVPSVVVLEAETAGGEVRLVVSPVSLRSEQLAVLDPCD